MAIRAEREPEVSVAEFVEHPAALRGLRRDSPQYLNARKTRIETEEISGITMHTVDGMLRRIPNGLPPVVSHASWRCGVIGSKVILLQVFSFYPLDGVTVIAVSENRALRRGEVNGAVVRVDYKRTAER